MEKSILEIEIEKRNSIWSSASRSERKVLLAKDVLLQIETNKIIPTEGEWLTFTLGKRKETCNLQEEFLSNSVKGCQCCALGGLMLSNTLYKNNVYVPCISDEEYTVDDENIYTVDDENIYTVDFMGHKSHDEKSTDQLRETFYSHELELIEEYFECGLGLFSTGIKFSSIWHEKNEYERLISIMENIVENSGEFIPRVGWTSFSVFSQSPFFSVRELYDDGE